MAGLATSKNVPLPKNWSKNTKLAFLNAVSLAHRAIVVAHSWCANSRIPGIRRTAEIEHLKAQLALSQEIQRIKDARWSHIPPEKRPHYPPTERLAILAIRAAQGWNKAQTGREFAVTGETIARWTKRLDDEGEDALVALPTPVNRFPDFVTLLVQQLKSMCPIMGKQRISDTLARAGLHLSASTAGRMIKKNIPKPNPTGTEPTKTDESDKSDTVDEATIAAANGDQSNPTTNAESADTKPKRVVTAKRPDHVWHADLSAFPTWQGFWVPWVPYSWVQAWPFSFWVLVVVDHFSRKTMMIRCFRGIPSAAKVIEAMDVAIAIAGRAPKYIITDQGAQFRDDYRDWCELRGIKPRFGAIGQHGSIAICERFIRTIKQECARRIIIPLRTSLFEAELISYALWYNEHRPHQSLQGRTPNEVYEGRVAARDEPRLEVRRVQKGDDAAAEGVEPIDKTVPRLRLVVKHFEGRKHLPIVELERAA